MKKRNLLLTVLLMSLAAVTTNAQKYVGGDISLLPKYEANNAIYYDKNGKKITDVIAFMKEQGMNSMRVRLFVDPSKASDTHKKEGVCQDLDYVKALGKRIKDAGLYFLLDFHYSDTWTDPGKHAKPDAWKDMTATELAEEMYNYTKESLQTLNEYGAQPDAIQVGNELNVGQLWDGTATTTQGNASARTYPTQNGVQMTNFINYLNQAITACRDVCPQAKVVFHVAMNYTEGYPAHTNDQARNWATVLKNKGVDYDVFGLSYYPYYHGALSELETLLKYLEINIPDKKVQIVEAGYPNAWYPSDAKYDYTTVYPATAEGQRQFTAALIEKLNTHEQVNGLYWWYPEANGNYFASDWYNMGLWNNSTHRAQPALYELKNFLNDPSGINELKKVNKQQPVSYNLQGQCVDADYRGIAIQNGKVVVMK